MPCSFCMSTNQFVMIVHVYMLRHWWIQEMFTFISAGVFVQISNEKFLKFYNKYLRGSWFWFDWATCMAWCPAFKWLSCKKCWDASRMFYYWAGLWCRWVISLSYFFFPFFFFEIPICASSFTDSGKPSYCKQVESIFLFETKVLLTRQELCPLLIF